MFFGGAALGHMSIYMMCMHITMLHVTFLVDAILVLFIFTQANVLNRFLKTLLMEEKWQSLWPNLYLP